MVELQEELKMNYFHMFCQVWKLRKNKFLYLFAQAEKQNVQKVNYSYRFCREWELRKDKFFDQVSRRNCPLCDSAERTFFCTSLDGYEYGTCDTCGMLYASEFFPMSFWNEVYHQIPQIREIEKARETEQSQSLEISTFDKERFSYLFDQVEQLSGSLAGKRYLDIGTFYGGALRVAKDYGMDAYGIEGKREIADFVVNNFGLNVINQISDDLGTPVFDGNFDLISAFEVLEHSPNPLESLRRIHSNLVRGGLLVVTVPNGDNFELQILREYCPHLMGGAVITGHINYFTQKTLRMAMEKSGFEVVAEFTQYSSSFLNVYLHYTGRTNSVPNYASIVKGEIDSVQLTDQEAQLINNVSPQLKKYEDANNRGPIICTVVRKAS